MSKQPESILASDFLRSKGWVQDREGYWLKPSLGRSQGILPWSLEGALQHQVMSETIPEAFTETRCESPQATSDRIAARVKQILGTK